MLGKTYEQTGEMEKALRAYKVLNEQYPKNIHARIAKDRLEVLNRARHTNE